MNDFGIYSSFIYLIIKSGILVPVYIFLVIWFVFYRLRDKIFYPYPAIYKKALFYTYVFLVLEMILIAIIEEHPFDVFQFLLITLFFLSLVSITIIFKKYKYDAIMEKHKHKIITAAIIQIGIFITAANINNINVFIKFFSNISAILMPAFGILGLNESKTNKDD